MRFSLLLFVTSPTTKNKKLVLLRNSRRIVNLSSFMIDIWSPLQITDDKPLIYEAFKHHLTSDHLPPGDKNYSINSSTSWIEIQLPWSLQDHKVRFAL